MSKKVKYGNYDAVEKDDGIHVVPNSAPPRPVSGTKAAVNDRE